MSYAVTISSGWNLFMEDFRGEAMKYMRTCSCLYARLFISKAK